MADDLTIVASILRDTNKKLDKLHAHNVKSDEPLEIVKHSIPEVLADTRNTRLSMAQSERHETDRKKEGIAQSKIFADLKKPMTDLGLAVPSGFNAFSKKANEITAEKSVERIPEIKLLMQALTPKALTEGFKVGLGDMFKELSSGIKKIGGGIKKIGGGMKSLATKGLTAAQRKSEEKEKESKEKRRDGFFKNQFGKITGFLGGILRTAKMAGKAGFLALLGAGAVFALAKLIESPYWNTVAGIIESGFNRIKQLFEFMDEQFGPAGVLATALGLFYGPRAVVTLAGAGIKALARKLFFKGATDTLASTATSASTSLTKKGGLLRALGRFAGPGGVAVLAAAAVYGLIKGMEALAKRNAEFENSRLSASQKRIAAVAGSVDQGSSDAEIESARKNLVKEKAKAQQILDRSSQLAGAVNKEVAENARLTVEATQKALDQIPKVQRSFGSNPREMGKAINEAFRDAINSTTFTGDAENRKAQIRGISDNVFRDFVKSKEFANLPFKQAQAALKSFQRTELANLQKLIFGRDSTAKLGPGMKNRKELESVAAPLLMEITRERKEQIKDPTKAVNAVVELENSVRNLDKTLREMKDNPRGSNAGSINQTNINQSTNSNVTIPQTGSNYGQIPDGGLWGQAYQFEGL